MNKEFLKNAPVLDCENADVVKAFDAAKYNFLAINTIPCDFGKYNKTGLINRDSPYIFKAGGRYDTPWTRDASINSLCAGNYLLPLAAQNTLFAQCERDERGDLIIIRDNQIWDKIVWALGGYHNWLCTKDEVFFKNFYETVSNTLEILINERFDKDFGLFRGGSFFNDGISGYPKDLDTTGCDFIGLQPLVDGVFALSTNCIYYAAYRIAGKCAEALGDTEKAEKYRDFAAILKETINEKYYENGKYCYLIYPNGSKVYAQEAFGNIFAVLSGVCTGNTAERVISELERGEYGIMSIIPAFEGVSTVEKPGRHNNCIWPFANGLLAYTAAKVGDMKVCSDEIAALTALYKGSDFSIFEVYNGYTGEVFGGWQIGGIMPSCEDQTWSATAYIKAIIGGAMGIDVDEKGIYFAPCLPEMLKNCEIKNLCIGKAKLNVKFIGHGKEIKSLTVDSVDRNSDFHIPVTEGKDYDIAITLA